MSCFATSSQQDLTSPLLCGVCPSSPVRNENTLKVLREQLNAVTRGAYIFSKHQLRAGMSLTDPSRLPFSTEL